MRSLWEESVGLSGGGRKEGWARKMKMREACILGLIHHSLSSVEN